MISDDFPLTCILSPLGGEARFPLYVMSLHIPHLILFGLDCAFETRQEKGIEDLAVEGARSDA